MGADSDSVCGDLDKCPYDSDNDFDGDNVCGDIDICPKDPLKSGNSGYCGCGVLDTDVDNDGLLLCDDTCPIDVENDIDSDNVCYPADSCPKDPENDIDNDGACGDVDKCPTDANNIDI